MPCGVVPYPFGDCRVCADKATGIHYGVATCEGCKGFYKRSLPKASSYRCFFGGSCVLSKHNRNRCKACRFKRCLQVGMSTTAVKMGRIPKVDKERALQAFHQKQQSAQPQAVNGIPQPDSSTPEVQHHGGSTTVQSNGSQENAKLWPVPASAGNHDSIVHNHTTPVQHPGMPYGLTSDNSSPTSGDVYHMNNGDVLGLVSELGVQSHEQPHYSSPGSHDVTPHQPHQPDNLERPPSETGPSPGLGKPCSPPTGSVSEPPRPESVKSNSSSTRGIFSPVIIKELLTQVIQSGNGANLKESLKNQLLSPNSEGSPHSIIQEAIRSCDESHKVDYHESHNMLANQEPDSSRPDFHWQKTDKSWPGYSSVTLENPNVKTFDGPEGDISEQHPQKELDVQWMHTKQAVLESNDAMSSDMRQLQDGAATCQKETYISAGKLTDQLILGILQEAAQSTAGNTPSTISSSVSVHGVHDNHQVAVHANEYSVPPGDGFSSHMTDKLGDPDMELRLPEHSELLSLPDEISFCDQTMMTVVHDMVSDMNQVENQGTINDKLMDVDPFYVKRIEERFSFIYNIAHEVIRLHERFMMLERAGRLPIHPLNKVMKATKCQVQYLWDLVTDSVPESNKLILEFCQLVPHFSAINSSDQALLLQEAYFDVWLICHSKLFHGGDTYLRFKCNTRYSRFWMSHILPDSLICDLHKFTSELNSYKLRGPEIIALCVLRLINPEREGLTDVELVHRIHGHYFDVLMNLIEKGHKGNHGTILVGLIQLMPSLTSLNNEQKGVMDSFSVDNIPNDMELSDKDEFGESAWKTSLDLSAYEKLELNTADLT